MESVYSALTRGMMRGNTRGGLLMKKSATEGVFFGESLPRREAKSWCSEKTTPGGDFDEEKHY